MKDQSKLPKRNNTVNRSVVLLKITTNSCIKNGKEVNKNTQTTLQE